MSTTRSYTVLKPRHLVRRTARVHMHLLERGYRRELKARVFPSDRQIEAMVKARYETRDLGRGPFRWAVVDYGAQ